MDTLIGENEGYYKNKRDAYGEEIKNSERKRDPKKITIEELGEGEEGFLTPWSVVFAHREDLMPWDKKTLGSAGAFYIPKDAGLHKRREGTLRIGIRKQGRGFVILLPKEVSLHSLSCLGISISIGVERGYFRIAGTVALIRESLPHELQDCQCDKKLNSYSV